jgi:5'-3' exonuclease
MKEIDTTKNSFIKEYGFEPKYMLDYLILIGDNSDNVPGVNGI